MKEKTLNQTIMNNTHALKHTATSRQMKPLAVTTLLITKDKEKSFEIFPMGLHFLEDFIQSAIKLVEGLTSQTPSLQYWNYQISRHPKYGKRYHSYTSLGRICNREC